MRKTLCGVALGALALMSGAAMDAGSTLTVDILGPGGHSNGDYGNVNAVHAAARAVMNLEKAVPDAVVSHINGGASVNAIAADAHFKIMITGKDAADVIKRFRFPPRSLSLRSSSTSQELPTWNRIKIPFLLCLMAML